MLTKRDGPEPAGKGRYRPPIMNDLGPTPYLQRSLPQRALAIAVAVSIVVAVAAWFFGRNSARIRDAEITAGSPILNVHSDVSYVGDAKCARCHPEIARTYREHPMGRSLTEVKDAALPLGTSDPRPSFVAQDLEYEVERHGDRLVHKETRKSADGRILAKNEAEARFVIGSGQQALAFVLDRGGYLFQSPITYYSRKKKWDLSPGYERDNPHFERSIKTACLYCHANRFDQVEGSENHYREPIFQGHSIGCERCHGPGGLHVKNPESNDPLAPNIVNPARLEPALRESVCQQCHLQGDDRIVREGRRLDEYRPGLPLHRFQSVFVKGSTQGAKRFFGQVEQMYESRCFTASGGKMGCISCHDPHELPSPAEKVAYYRGRCMDCHAEKGCRLPSRERTARSREDSCIECHMPRSPNEQVPHTATTLHLISRFAPGDDAPVSPAAKADDKYPLVHFHDDLLSPAERAEVKRDLGIALSEKSRAFPMMNPAATNRLALPLIEASLDARPFDPPAWLAKGNIFWELGRREASLDAFRKAMTQAPDREDLVVAAGSRLAQMKKLDEALDVWTRAIAMNPHRSDYQQVLALVHSQRADWARAAESARRSVELNPLNNGARLLLVQSLLKIRKTTEATAEFQVALECAPPSQRGALQKWFSESAH